MLNERDYELLSSYIDGELSASERMALESRLDAEDDLRRELASLRQTVALVHQLPKLKAPRNFTLEHSLVNVHPLPFPMTATFSALSAAAAVLLIVFGGYLLAFSGNSFAPSQMAREPAPVAQAPTDAAAAQDSFELNQVEERDRTGETQTQAALEHAVVVEGETETPLADSLPSAIALPTMTAAAEIGITAQGGAGAAQPTQAALYAAPAETQHSQDMTAPMMLQQAESPGEDAASSATSMMPAPTMTPMPTAAPESGDSISVQRALSSTEAPLPTAQPAPIPQQKVGIQLDTSVAGLLSIIIGFGLLIAALATTWIRRRRKAA